MEETLDAAFKDAVSKGGNVTIDVIGVSAKFSGPFLTRVFNKLLTLKPDNLRLNVQVCVTRPEKLAEWKVTSWMKNCQNSIDIFTDYMEAHCEGLSKSGIKVAMYEYDNLPHWHGVLLNRQHLFMGRTEWFQNGDDEFWDLRVGEVEYREFKLDDHYGGTPRIERFSLWLDRYIARARENGWVHTCGSNCVAEKSVANDTETTSKPR